MKLNKKGFTLIELLGVIVIIGLIIAGTTYGLIKLIDRSKEEKTNISISSIKETASVYANEKNDDEDYWNEITRPGYEGKYFCVTIEELMNKGLLDKNIDFNSLSKGENPIDKTTYVGIKKDLVTLTNGRAMLLNNVPSLDDMGNLNEEQKMYGICTGNIKNEKITKDIVLKGGNSFTDEIYGIEFSEIEGENIEIDKSDCLYSRNSSNFPKENIGNITGNTCNVNNLEARTDYYIRICTYTKGGSSSCATTSIPTKEVPKPSITLSDKVNITYNTNNINGASYYYFKSTISGTSNINVSTCTLNSDNTFTCNNDSITNITKDVWYKSPNTNISISYSISGTGTVYARTYDKSNNFNENSKEFSVYKVTFNKGDADKIGGVASNIDKLCLAEKNGSCSITSPSIEKAGYTAVGWNTDSSASTSTWNVGISKSINSDGTYYPITKKIEEYTISYDANGGYNAPSDQIKKHDIALTLSSTKPTRSGYNFKGWGTSKYSSSVAYNAGGRYTANSSITLYAVWSEVPKSPPSLNYSPSGGSSVCSGTKVTLTCTDRSGDGMSEAKINDNGTIRTGTSSASDYLNTTRNGNITTYFSCTDKGGRTTTATVKYTVTNCSSGGGGSSGGGTTTKKCPSGYVEYSSVQCRKKVGAATCAATCRTYDTNKTKCKSYSTYCNWNGAGRGACPPKTQYEGKCLSYKCTTGTLSGTNCYLYANKS